MRSALTMDGSHPGTTVHRLLRAGLVSLLLVLTVGAVPEDARAPSAPGGWIEVDYADLVDRRQMSHSGEPVGVLLDRLAGRPVPVVGQRPDDDAAHRALDPLLEPYAFVLSDALDALSPVAESPFVEVGDLWRPGEAQPAWAELLRARRFLVESDGRGRIRACLPLASNPPEGGMVAPSRPDPEAAGKQAWEAAWPVLRHMLAAERRRLAGREALDVEVHAYDPEPARTRFRLGVGPYRVKVEDTRSRGDRIPLDLAEWQSFLDKGLELDGGRIGPDGSLRLLGSQPARRPTLLGRPLTLEDFAVAYRAVFHGGAGEPYMSLDRGDAPEISVVNYGGRLHDTALGLVTLLCDIRFKTFSLGIDVVEGEDVRSLIRRQLPSFRTHLERFALDPGSRGVLGQQTRLWFYPDGVDVAMSAEGDAMVMSRARMTAASERLAGPTAAGERVPDPAWTRETVGAVNRDYDALARAFPEMADLDQAVRLLTLFTWLRQLRDEGHELPDLDALLALELPPLPTPRSFPQLLTFNTLPPAGKTGGVEVYERTAVGEALDRLRPADGRRLPAVERFRRAVAGLDGRLPDDAALLKELEAKDPGKLDPTALDLESYRAERLAMQHRLTLSPLTSEQKEAVARREKEDGSLRVLSVGIGGVDLGMGQAIARAKRGNRKLAWGGAVPRSAPDDTPARGSRPAAASAGIRPREDSSVLPPLALPEHGASEKARGGARSEFGGSWIALESAGEKGAGRSVHVVVGADGPDLRSRRLVLGPDGRSRIYERVEGSRFVRYRMDADRQTLRARIVSETKQDATAQGLPEPPRGIAILEVAASASGDTPTVRLRLGAAGRKPVEAAVPRGVMQRLVLGKEVDLLPGRPLPGFDPPGQLLGDAQRLMVLMSQPEIDPPWTGFREVRPGEEDAVRVAGALGRWWEGSSGASAVVVGTDPRRSPSRWESAPRVGMNALLLVPDDAFPGPAARLRGKVAASWGSGKTGSGLSGREVPGLVVLVSAESPGTLARRLRVLARDPAMKGKLLAVASLAGPIRQDLPASLLAEGNLAAIGTAVGRGGFESELSLFGKAVAEPSSREARVEELPGPFLWFF